MKCVVDDFLGQFWAQVFTNLERHPMVALAPGDIRQLEPNIHAA